MTKSRNGDLTSLEHIDVKPFEKLFVSHANRFTISAVNFRVKASITCREAHTAKS